jgi:DNA-directed RNA polymerase subunit RPC12/RpoP
MKEQKENGVTVRYSGEGLVRDWEYKCYGCAEEVTISHTRMESMRGRECPHCKGELGRMITAAPALDADFHEGQKSHNLGWD